MAAPWECTLDSAHLTLNLTEAKHAAKIVYEEERARVLRVNLLLQEYANDEMQEELERVQEVDLRQAEDLAEDLQIRLDFVQQQYEQSQAELKACMRDIDEYHTQLNAFATMKADATKHLSERLACERQLSVLQPEVDHLRSQITLQNNILADKLSLQRELAAAQVELENERRIVQRLKQSNAGDVALQEQLQDAKNTLDARDASIQKLEERNRKLAKEKSIAEAASLDELDAVKAQLLEARQRAEEVDQALKQVSAQDDASEESKILLQELKKALAKEKKALLRAETEQLQKTSAWDAEREKLDTKLDAFRERLRTTKARLYEAEEKLEKQESAKFAQSAAANKARMTGRAPSVEPVQASTNLRKRNVARFDPDMTIGTPGHAGPAAKKSRLTTSSFGDKSTFSITPFLNRTMSILPESPSEQIHQTIDEIADEAEKEVDDEITKPSSGKRTTAKTSQSAKGRPKPAMLSKVIEEDDEAEQEQEEEDVSHKDIGEPTQTSAETTLALPKKKMVLNSRRHIFDDDESGGIKKASATRSLGKVNLGLGKGRPNKSVAIFSPLKKDRKPLVNTTA